MKDSLLQIRTQQELSTEQVLDVMEAFGFVLSDIGATNEKQNIDTLYESLKTTSHRGPSAEKHASKKKKAKREKEDTDGFHKHSSSKHKKRKHHA